MFHHSLIIGGTGMLQDASIALGRRSRRMTSVARTRASLDTLQARLPERSAEHHRLALDWHLADDFLSGIIDHLRATGVPDLVLAWTHEDDLAVRLTEALSDAPCAFFHVMGSGGDHPLHRADAVAARVDRRAALAYHQIILGHIHSGAERRWLTHEEISAGALEAIDTAAPRYVIGHVEGAPERP